MSGLARLRFPLGATLHEIIRAIMIQVYVLSGHNADRVARSLGLPPGHMPERFNALDSRSEMQFWVDFRIGTALGDLERSAVIQTWLYNKYSAPKTAAMLDVPVSVVEYALRWLYDAKEYVGTRGPRKKK